MKKILLLGNTGFVGSRLEAALSKIDGFSVSGVSRSAGFDLAEQNVASKLPPADVVISLAGAVGVPKSWEDPEFFYRQNFLCALTALEFCRKQKAHLIFLSSYLYGNPAELPIAETHPLNPLNPYASSKAISESLCQSYFREFGVNATVVRPFNIYGSGGSQPTLIAGILRQLEKNPEEITLESTTTRRDFIHVEDVVKFLVALSVKPKNGFHVYNIGSGKSYSVPEVVETFEKVLGHKIRVIDKKEARKNEILDCYSDNTLAAQAYGFQPSISLEEGILNISKHLRTR